MQLLRLFYVFKYIFFKSDIEPNRISTYQTENVFINYKYFKFILNFDLKMLMYCDKVYSLENVIPRYLNDSQLKIYTVNI